MDSAAYLSEQESENENFVDAEEIVDVDTQKTTHNTKKQVKEEIKNSNNDHNNSSMIPEISVTDTAEEQELDITVYVKDLDTGRNVPMSDIEQELNKSKANIDPLSFQIMQRAGSDNEFESDNDDNDNRSRRVRSISNSSNNKFDNNDEKTAHKDTSKSLKRPSHQGRDGSGEAKDDEKDEVKITGNNAEIFSETTNDFGRQTRPQYIKAKIRNKHTREFDHLFLAQELSSPKPSTECGAIWTMSFSKDGKFLATGGQDTVVRVWAVISSDEEREYFLGRNGKKNAFDDVSGTKLGAPVFREKPLYEYTGHTADLLDLSWSKNNFLLSSSMDKTVRLWHITRKECLCCFQHTDFVTSIAFHPKDDRFFLSGSLDCKLRLWNISEKRVAHWHELTDSQLITSVGFTLDGKFSVVGTLKGLCLFYETDGLRYHTQIHVKSSHGRNSQGKKITGIEPFPGTPAGQEKLLISSNDSRIRLYNMRDKSLECKYKGMENTCGQISATFSDDGRYIITGSEDRHVYIFNADQASINSSHYGSSSSGNSWLKKGKTAYETHPAVVTTAIFAPTRTKQLIAHGGDPIYSNTINHDTCIVSDKFTYPDGNIIVSADNTGRIKIFRQDCAYYHSHDNDSSSILSTRSWNSNLSSINSLFSKPINFPNRLRRKSDASSLYSGNSNDGSPKLVCAICHKPA
nr:8891_t:CDS:10 [Entrophospora candida]